MQHEDFESILMQCYETAVSHEDELFGGVETLADDEFDIVFSNMPHPTKLELLTTLRALKAQGMSVSNTSVC